MTKFRILTAIIFTTILTSCNSEKPKKKFGKEHTNETKNKRDTLTKHLKPFKLELPTIGLLMYDGVLQSEVIATSDVF
ncbi:hypothetical protein [Wenyingzhuangia sp. 2_MG-2023]|uniref:hypothetical protein n=1 Tax=Wenyingzhuangia sp. 2_MG-2023 TaxID=3062639 RepID=UPI003014873B